MNIKKQWISSEVLFSAIQELLAENRQAVFTVTGMSMWPFLCHGRDQVIVEKCDSTTLKTGDIILFQKPEGKYILHRITKIEDDLFETTGDGNCFRDGFFSFSCVKAKVVCLIRKDKKIDCKSWIWKVVFQTWMLLFPIRKYLLKFLKNFSRTRQRLLNVIKSH